MLGRGKAVGEYYFKVVLLLFMLENRSRQNREQENKERRAPGVRHPATQQATAKEVKKGKQK